MTDEVVIDPLTWGWLYCKGKLGKGHDLVKKLTNHLPPCPVCGGCMVPARLLDAPAT